MKKTILISGLACLSIFATVFYSCNKSTNSISPTTITKKTRSASATFTFQGKTIAIENDRVKFASFDDYEYVANNSDQSELDEFITSLNNTGVLTSYNSIANHSNDDAFKFNFIGDIVNSQGIIEIDNFLVLLDFEASKVFASKTINVQNLLDAKNGTVNNDVSVFDMDEDVIEELKIKKTRGLFCGDRHALGKTHTSPKLETTARLTWKDCDTVHHDCRISLELNTNYCKYGIWFKLYSELQSKPWQTATSQRQPQWSFHTTFTFTKRCGPTVTGTDNQSAATCVNCGDLCVRKMAHTGTRSLKTYNITADAHSSESTTPGASITSSVAD